MKEKISILIADDEENILKILSRHLKKKELYVKIARDGEEAIELFFTHRFDILLADLAMPDIDGIDLFKKIKKFSPSTLLFLMTGFGTVETVVQAIKAGAMNYLSKPFRMEQLDEILSEAYEIIRKRRKKIEEAPETKNISLEKNLICVSKKMEKIQKIALRAAQIPSPILLTGPTGSGKEVIARAIHQSSSQTGPFLAVNCAALPPTLLESELFGHQKGSFTGAIKDTLGYFRSAEGGTLLLDEIGEMPLETQAKLLRVIQTHEVVPIGSVKPYPFHIKLMTATNCSLEEEVSKGNFRKDLYYRIAVLNIVLPSLRERQEDIPLLVYYFNQRISFYFGMPMKKISSEAMKKLKSYPWPGNVRELENMMERIYAEDQEDVIDAVHLSFLSVAEERKKNESSQEALISLEEYEKYAIEQALKNSDGNKAKAAKTLKIHKTRLYRLIKKFNLSP